MPETFKAPDLSKIDLESFEWVGSKKPSNYIYVYSDMIHFPEEMAKKFAPGKNVVFGWTKPYLFIGLGHNNEGHLLSDAFKGRRSSVSAREILKSVVKLIPAKPEKEGAKASGRYFGVTEAIVKGREGIIIDLTGCIEEESPLDHNNL